MQKTPPWIQPAATAVALLVAALLLAGILMVPYRSMQAPEGYDQPRVHWNTKNSTRLEGATAEEVAARVSQAVYPATAPENRPDVAILYAPEDWASGLLAATLLRPLNAVLLPATSGVADEIERLQPPGSAALDGASVLLLNGAQAPGVDGRALARDEIVALRGTVGEPPRHAIVVSEEDPATALLAAPWAAYSGDLVVLEAGQAPGDLPLYRLGAAGTESAGTEPAGSEIDPARRIAAGTGARTAVRFATYEDPQNPLFGWGLDAGSLEGYRAYTLAREDQPEVALLSANLARRGKPGPLLWSEQRHLPQVVDNYLWSQRAAFWVTPSEGPFHHFWVLGDTNAISFPAQGQADYAVEIGPYLGKGVGASGIDMLAAAWVMLGIASAAWVLFHEFRYLVGQNWVVRLAWPLLALMLGPFGILFYYLAYRWPVTPGGKMTQWDRPLWAQGMVATASAVGLGAALMIVTGYVATTLGLPLLPGRSPLFLLGTPMILVMILNYVVAVLVSWLLFQTPMLSGFYGRPYREALPLALPVVLASMTAAAVGMNPAMWWLMMSHVPMMPDEESILWFGIMFFTAFVAFLLAWPLNYLLVRAQRKSGLM